MTDQIHGVDDPSSVRYQHSPILVSSVGFNTLKKQPTNSSNTSSLVTLSSRSHPLARLFTRNKIAFLNPSEPLEIQPIGIPAEDDEKDVSHNSKSFGIFNVSRRQKSKLNLSNKPSKKPELTIQTGGHSSLKIPKKILSSENAIEINKLSSPVSRHPIYRPLILSFADNQSRNSHDEVCHGSAHYNVNPHRTAVTLSSRSSNSFITDVDTAVMFNFTDPDFTGTSDDQMLDLHRRYMTSADYYMQKLHKSPNVDGSPISSNPSPGILKDEKLRRGLVLNGRDNDRIFLQLFDMLRPIFTPSKDMKLQTGYDHSKMTLSVEHVANFVKKAILPAYLASDIDAQFENESDRINVHTQRSRANTVAATATLITTGPTSSNTLSGQFVEDDLIEIESKELALRLSSFFFKCCQTLARDLDLNDKKVPESEPLLHRWKFVCNAWIHFNSKSRFFLLHVFFQVELYFEIENSKRLGSKDPRRVVKCEKELLIAFRDTFIVPLLRQRSIELDRLSHCNRDSGHVKGFLEAEKMFFVQDPLKVKKILTTCFGILSSHSQEEKLLKDDLQSTNFLFFDFVQCFDSYTRA